MRDLSQYSGYKRKNGLKFHAAICPAGISVHGFGPGDGRRHDTTVLAYSGIMEQVPLMVENSVVYYIYSNKAYKMAPNFMVEIPKPADGSAAACLNKLMANIRTCTSEWYYQVVNNYFQNLLHKDYQMILKPGLGSSSGWRCCLQT